jgi:glycosyltransferase involved in cell wall biosynthesis
MTATQPVRLRRALILLPSAALGGTEAMTAVLARALSAHGVQLEIVVAPGLSRNFADMLGLPIAPALGTAPLDWRESEEAGQNWRRQEAVLAPRLLAARPDIAILPLPWPSHGHGLLAELHRAGVPTLLIAHLAPLEPDASIEAAARRHAGPSTPGLLWAAVSRPVAQRIETWFGLPSGSTPVVPNGVRIPRVTERDRLLVRQARRASLGLPGSAPLVVVAGSVEPRKGSDLLPAIAQALRRRAGVTLVVLGDGPARPDLAAREAAGGGDAPLRVLGRVEDVGEWLIAADLLLLPSRLEGCPLVFLEAAARRCPVVASAAALEAFGDAAWEMAAVAEDDMAAALVDHALVTLRSPEQTRLRTAAAFRHAAAWDEAAMQRGWLGVLRAAAAGPALRAA